MLRVYTNEGYQDSKMVRNFPDFFKVWYNQKLMVSILLFSEVRKDFRITIDTLKL